MSKCNYCAFYSRACTAPNWDEYCDKIIGEFDLWGECLGKISVPTIFFGGGTPSLMPTATFEKIIRRIYDTFDVPTDAEVTIESNPGTLDNNKLLDFLSLGVNRLSIGVQSLNDEKLKFLGRRHSANDARRLIDFAISRVRTSADFIYGLPGEDAGDVIQTCHDINELGLGHVSMYELTIEPDTPFGKMNLNMPDNTTMAQMYMAIDENLPLPRYEVSNYATPGDECRHNLNIWDGGAYIGVGSHAAGRVFKNNTWYEQLGDGELFSQITEQNRAVEKIITGMRTTRGVKLTPDVIKQIDMGWVENNSDLVTTNDNRIACTKKGMLILDEILLNLTK